LAQIPLGQLRWSPIPIPSAPLTFLDGVRTMTTAGDAGTQTGMAAHVYLITRSMTDSVFYNADGEMLFVPQENGLRFVTEFRVELIGGPARGYICENYGGAFTLPERGPIGANCLANARDFLSPVAAYEDREVPTTLTVKWGGTLWQTTLPQSPLDVVAWHGNYCPFKYDLKRFNAVGSISFDHPDPSIYTVLSAPSDSPGTSNVDFVIFPDRWNVAEDTFRPPWYHRNIMSEFMGLLYGVYDARPKGFLPGGISLHNQMLPHGPSPDAFEHASTARLEPTKLSGAMAFMFETRYPQRVTHYAGTLPELQSDYGDTWTGLKKRFDPERR
jgi:homogentisate 1,2-dioxygenase